MRIVIVAATELEIEALRNHALSSTHTIDFAIHGIGMMLSMFNMQKIVQTKPDLIIQCGLAGAYSTDLALGETVMVHSERLGDTGSEDHDNFIDLFDMNFLDKNTFPFIEGNLINPSTQQYASLKKVNSITVNSCAGKESTIQWRQKKYNADIESMEGACLHYCCLMSNIEFMQFRGISNYVEPRNKSNWKIAEAIENCHAEVIRFIQQLSQ